MSCLHSVASERTETVALRTLWTDTAFNRARNGQLATTDTAAAFVPDFRIASDNAALQVLPDPFESLNRFRVATDLGLLAVEEHAPAHVADIGEAVFVVGPVQQRHEAEITVDVAPRVGAFVAFEVRGLNAEGEPRIGHLRDESNGCVAAHGELEGIGCGGEWLGHVRVSCFKLPMCMF